MTLDELERIEAIFRNPPSTGVLAEHGLVLCAQLRPLLAREPFSIGLDLSPVVVVPAVPPLDLAVKEALVMPESFSAVAVEALGESDISHDANPELDAVPDVGDADPTPPHSPKAKKGKR